MTVNVALTRTSDSVDRRHDPRFELALSADVEWGSHTEAARIENLSQEGFLLHAETELPVGEVLTINVPGSPSRRATVQWREGELHGCRFELPLPPSAVSAARLRSPPAEARDGRSGGQDQSVTGLIEEILASPGMTRIELARLLGISRPALWAWEKGQSAPRSRNLDRLREIGLSVKGPVAASGEKDEVVQDGVRQAFDALVAIFRDGMGMDEEAMLELTRASYRRHGLVNSGHGTAAKD